MRRCSTATIMESLPGARWLVDTSLVSIWTTFLRARGSRFGLLRLSEDSYFGKDIIKKHFYDPYNNEKTIKNLKELQTIAKELGCTLGQLALAWVIYNKDVNTAITGARSVEQITESLQALEIYKKWTPELDLRINTLMGTTPTPKMDYKTFTPGKPRRA
jgi:hypothetical protein